MTTQMAAVRAYHAPHRLSDCLEVLQREGDRALVMAGGQTVMPLLRSRQLRPEVLVDLGRVDELRGIRLVDDGSLEIGAMARYRDLQRERAIGPGWAALTDAAAIIGDRQVQNRGTLVGNLVFGGLGTDMRQVVICLAGELALRGRDGERTVRASDVLVGEAPFLDRAELVRAVRFPAPAPGTATAYMKYGITANGRAVIGAAARVTVDGDGVCTDAALVVGGVQGGPCVSEQAAAVLVGETANVGLLRVAADAAAAETDPHHDARGTADYRRQLIRVYGRRALERALARALEEQS